MTRPSGPFVCCHGIRLSEGTTEVGADDPKALCGTALLLATTLSASGLVGQSLEAARTSVTATASDPGDFKTEFEKEKLRRVLDEPSR